MPGRSTGAWLIGASLSFWLAWALMPGVGVTDAGRIFSLVGAHRESVLASVVLQLGSAAAYAPGLAGILAAEVARREVVRLGAVLLAIGAMGSAADAMLHLVAYEMTAPGVARDAMEPVMRRLQGTDLALLLPFVVAFFAGHAVLLGALRRTSPGAVRLLLLAPVLAALGAAAARAGLAANRSFALASLAALAGSLAWLGLTLVRRAPEARRA
jgi:hypothetical protein